MFTKDKAAFAKSAGHAKVTATLSSHAPPWLATAARETYFMGFPALLDLIAAVPPIGATCHGREL
ncbi:hypothetical protein [Devosia sediminis]|uniref:Uncharacterized protein n=1 Tax=Devosia sediminis TaxID=2798801 RepID=A0A934IW42_9HYPH|nr:hypothetical protein [Devosia sediminis]MBJ3784181.1 hypothetical protein [Devosia sediminis]